MPVRSDYGSLKMLPPMDRRDPRMLAVPWTSPPTEISPIAIKLPRMWPPMSALAPRSMRTSEPLTLPPTDAAPRTIRRPWTSPPTTAEAPSSTKRLALTSPSAAKDSPAATTKSFCISNPSRISYVSPAAMFRAEVSEPPRLTPRGVGSPRGIIGGSGVRQRL